MTDDTSHGDAIAPGDVLALLALRKRAMHLGEITARLGVPGERRDEVLDLLEALVEDGEVTELPGNRFRKKSASRRKSPDTTPGMVTGHLTVNPRGFGFVAAEDGGPDVFVPAEQMGAALHGDRVELQTRPTSKGREGRVIAVRERRSPRFTATLERRGRKAWLEPDDLRLRGPIAVIGEVPEGRASGLAVVAELTHFPQHVDDQPAARVVELLGVQGMTAVEVAKIKIREGVLEEFDEATREEARTFPDRVLPSEKEGREDLRELDLVTIDPDDARDHDDALFAEETRDGYRVVIAIADVSHYVRPGTAIDASAFARCTSIYLPDRAIPMLPPELSSNLASLVPQKDRLCMGVEVHLTRGGLVRRRRLFEGVMRSRGRLTYRGVARALGLTESGPKQPQADKRLPMLEALLELSRALRKKRMRRGALDFDLPEAKVLLDAHGVEPVSVERSREDPGVREAYRLVEEMMLLANEVVAGELKRLNVPAIFRAHGKPDEKKIELFARTARALGHDIDVEGARDPLVLSKFLRSIDGEEEAPILRYLLLRAMQQASYDVSAHVGHFGLATDDYLHFTSPIRRYPDLTVHRVVRAILRGEEVDAAALLPRLRKAARASSRLERRAMVVERDVVNLYRAILVRERVGEEFEGAISGVDQNAFYVSFDEPFVDAKVPVERLEDDYYELDALGIRLVGSRTATTFGLGDRLTVRLEEVNVARRELLAVPVGMAERRVPRGERDAGEQPPRRRRRSDGKRSTLSASHRGAKAREGDARRSRRAKKEEKRAEKLARRKRRRKR
ncbi:MAG: VacB/RNase II family 3'-5' exoribonuclease [Myxococcota bacterium]